MSGWSRGRGHPLIALPGNDRMYDSVLTEWRTRRSESVVSEAEMKTEGFSPIFMPTHS